MRWTTMDLQKVFGPEAYLKDGRMYFQASDRQVSATPQAEMQQSLIERLRWLHPAPMPARTMDEFIATADARAIPLSAPHELTVGEEAWAGIQARGGDRHGGEAERDLVFPMGR